MYAQPTPPKNQMKYKLFVKPFMDQKLFYNKSALDI